MIAATQALNVTSSRARGAKPAMGPEPATCPFAETSGNDGVTTLSDDLNRLVAGEKAAWDGFVQRYARVIYAAVQRRLVPAGRAHEADDVAQDVFVKLCSRDFKLLRNYDPGRAKLSTWLTVIANSTTIDHLRRQAAPATDIDALPQSLLAVEPKLPERIKIPPELLSPRQALVIELLYRRELEVAEAAEVMGVNPQTVRSMHHKALVKLRAHFQEKAD
jgi:RNA polymerase sigma-70 factor (ECF subfamily)